MYQPIQPHHLFQQSYEEKIDYRETVLPDLADVLVCMWESIAQRIFSIFLFSMRIVCL